MTILVIGRLGQLATALLKVNDAHFGLDLHASGRPELDLSLVQNAAAFIGRSQPSLVVNTAAYTAVDAAEADAAAAYRINADAVEEIAKACSRAGAPLVHISTDYVFDGRTSRPYREGDPIAPLQVYGASKAAGEARVREHQPDHLILRTSWLFGASGGNFVRTMLRLARERDEVAVVADQRGCPTHVDDLARVILTLAQRRSSGGQAGWGETYHAAGLTSCTWAEFAREIFEYSARMGGPSAKVREVSTQEFGAPAPRPADSVLDCSALERAFGLTIASYDLGLEATLNDMLLR